MNSTISNWLTTGHCRTFIGLIDLSGSEPLSLSVYTRILGHRHFDLSNFGWVGFWSFKLFSISRLCSWFTWLVNGCPKTTWILNKTFPRRRVMIAGIQFLLPWYPLASTGWFTWKFLLHASDVLSVGKAISLFTVWEVAGGNSRSNTERSFWLWNISVGLLFVAGWTAFQ